MSKRYCFTVNNYTALDVEVLSAADSHSIWGIQYLVYGREVGEEGTPHLQGAVLFEKKRSLPWLKKNFHPTAHFEVMRGTAVQAVRYCKKDGDFTEFGELPLDPGAREVRDWDNARQLAKEGRFDEIPSDLYIRYLGNFHRINTMHQVLPSDADASTGVWIYGKSGIGKSRYARHHYPGFYHKMPNKWWCGYTDQEYVIVDDVDPSMKYLAYYLKIWTDRYAFACEKKNGVATIRPKKVVITSQYTIEQCFDEIDAVAIRRRCEVIELVFPFVPIS